MKRVIAICALACVVPSALAAQSDRGNGIRTSMIETYVEPHQLLIYPFGAYTWTTTSSGLDLKLVAPLLEE